MSIAFAACGRMSVARRGATRVRRRLTQLAVLGAAAVLLALPPLLSGCGTSGRAASPSPSPSLTPVAEQQVIDMVELTAAAMEKDATGTVDAINAGQAPFVSLEHPDLYAFVYDMDVRMVANPDPTDVGRIMKDVPDPTGNLYRAEIVAGAVAHGTGWMEYVHEHHIMGGLYYKAAYYRLVTGSDGNRYVVCAARYVRPCASPLPSSSAGAAEAPTRADVRAFVKRAVAYAREVGREQALETFTQKGGEFHQGELYIYAYDFSGTVIGHGGDANLVGKNLIAMTDPKGVHVIQELCSLAEKGSGWLYYTWPNPTHGNRHEAKLGYVERVDSDWFLGSGAYGPAASSQSSGLEAKSTPHL
jgi:polar amino acid transport system substrate-binding protein